MDYLCELPNDAARRVALDSLPPDLNSTYERILDRVEASNTEVQKLVQRSLRWIICSETPLSLDALCEVVSVNEGDVILHYDAIADEEEILRWCSSLLRKSAAGDGLELAHFTVKEFLLSTVSNHSDRFAGYRIHSTDVHVEMGKICLTYLCLQDFNIDPAIERKALLRLRDTYSFWSYAAVYWPSHAREHLHDESLFSLAQRLFDPLKSKNFLSWAQTFVLSAYGKCLEEGLDNEKRVLFEKISQCSLAATPLHYAAMLALPHLCDWLLQKGCDVNQSSAFGRPLHCAVLGKCAPFGCADDPLEWGVFDSPWSADLVKNTVTLFIGAGADVHCSFSIHGSSSHYSLVKIGLLMSCYGVVRLLLKAGAIFDRSCIDYINNTIDCTEDEILDLLEEVEEKNLQEEDLGDFLRLRLKWQRTEAKKFVITKGQQSKDTPSCPTDDRALFLTATEFGQAETLKSLFLHRELNVDEELDANKRTALHIAAEKGFSDLIELLLERDANAHSLDCQGRTPLHHAAEAKDSRCISLLLEHGCDAAQVDHQGLTVWHLAALCGNIEALEILATRAAGTLLSTSDEPREGKTALLCAAQAGSEEGIKILLKLNGSLSDKSYDGSTMLHYAAKAENSGAFQALLNRGLDPHAQTKDGSSVLHCAAEGFSSREIIDLLIERGADPCIQRKDGATPIHLLCQGNKANEFSVSKEVALEKLVKVAKTLDQTNNEGLTALHLICQLSQGSRSDWGVQRAHATLLANGADPTIKDGRGKSSFKILLDAFGESHDTYFRPIFSESERKSLSKMMMCATLDHISDAEILNEKFRGLRPLSLAISYVDADMTAKMLEYPVDVDARNDDRYQHTALEFACIFGCRLKLFKTLLERSRKLSDRHGSGMGLIHFACKNNANTDLVSALLEAGANPNMRGFNNKTPLMFAAEAGILETMSLLLSHGADVSMVSSHGWNAAHFAALGGHETILQALTQTKIEFARTCPISWIGGRSSGANMLHIAASKGECAVIEYILDKQLLPDVNAGTNYQETALLFAAGEGHYRMVDSLLSRGADANIKHSTLKTSPLHASSHFGWERVVRLLVERGCDARTMDRNGLTAELYARRRGHTAIAELLREHVSNQGEQCL
jgi:ankyrin repeat protein